MPLKESALIALIPAIFLELLEQTTGTLVPSLTDLTRPLFEAFYQQGAPLYYIQVGQIVVAIADVLLFLLGFIFLIELIFQIFGEL
ncbi:MAG: hypothetical protein N3D12_01260 [Candidatus Methanomethyliaceae archaeon]|nr:hypothetical protein [Candidatus Methanomethyliaceae archaeon]